MNAEPLERLGLTADEFEAWPPLHRRVARGEQLSADERALYEKGLAALDRQDQIVLANASRNLVKAMADLEQSRQEHAKLMARREELDREIERLKSLFAEKTSELVGAKE